MLEKYWYEFSKIYGRIMRLELGMKSNAKYAIFSIYNKNALDEFFTFFNNKYRKKRYLQNGISKIDKILNSNRSNDDKFSYIIDMLYVSDLIDLTLKTKQFHNRILQEHYYFKIPDDIDVFKNQSKDIVKLRNSIAHYNFKAYEENKTAFLEALLSFEVHMGHNIKGVLELPKFQSKPSTPQILKAMYAVRPDLILDFSKKNECSTEYHYNLHRLLLSLFDDIAFYNGYMASELPSPWSVLRAVYTLRKQMGLSSKKNSSKQEQTTYPLINQSKETSTLPARAANSDTVASSCPSFILI